MIAAVWMLLPAAAPPTLQGAWHVSNAHVAPWVTEDAPRPDVTRLLGQRIEYAPDRVEGPAPLACAHARYESDARPFDGLFQGNLPAPPENGAGALGLVKAPVDSVSVTCDTGIFDLHFATPDAALLALDNAIWVLDRSPGAFAADGTPEHAVQQLLEDHYAHGLEFTPERMQAQKRWLSAALRAKVDAYFAQDFPEGDVPPIDGDPITDSQEYPPIFSVRAATVTGERADVPVRYDSGYESRTVHFQLLREAGAWRVDDIAYAHGTPFTALLAMKP